MSALLKDMDIITSESLPSGQSGNLTLTNKVLDRTLGRAWKGEGTMDAGETYVSIAEGGHLWMSNTPDEKRCIGSELYGMSYTAGMNILVGGLGLGFFLEHFQRDRYTPASLTVVEKSADVIALVYPAYAGLPWLRVEQGDIREYGKTGPHKFFDWCYVDIWGNYSTDLLEEMKLLRRSLLPVVKPGGGRIILWKEGELKYRLRQEKREEARWSGWR